MPVSQFVFKADMGDSNKQICRLCLDKTPACECDIIDETKKEMLEILLIKINFDIRGYAVACNRCLKMLQDSFYFKSHCVNTLVKTDKNVCMDKCRVCQWCMSLIESKDINFITDMTSGILFKDMIRNCFPEMDLNTVQGPSICKPCLNSMKAYYKLLKCCQEVEGLRQLRSFGTADITIPNGINKECNEIGKPIVIKEECSDADADVKPVMCPKIEHITSIKCEAIDIKDELSTGEEVRESVQSADIISSGKDVSSQRNSPIRKSKDKKYSCTKCPHSSKYSTDMKKHIDTHSTVHKCYLCTFVTDSRLLLNTHMGIHRGPTKAFGCHLCPYESENKYHLATHILKHKDKSEVVMHKCPQCQFESKYKSGVAMHWKLLHNEMYRRKPRKTELRFKCHYCDFKSVYKHSLNKHISMNHERDTAVVHYCRLCKFKTLHADSLRHHLNLHEKKEPFKCPGCEKAYNRKGVLDEHLLKNHDNFRHLIARSIHNCKFCPFQTTIPADLARHVAQKHERENAEKFVCDKCDYSAIRKDSLVQHLLVHADLKPYVCPVCKKGFNQKSHLDAHILTTHKKNDDLLKTITCKIHQCMLCQYRTVYRNDLFRHIGRMHKK